ncbi:hypothetical protein Q8A67_005703 [Cirrhinus molitorella]|uniref:NACHT domain-containing protein n=1 Tax=Cirrhinus molitorella TaxID=172907 RepID=A0AA88PWF9_9TELE|nr:hypothetical protein Q8A67_005703 [Cirrhinus molitorella]
MSEEQGNDSPSEMSVSEKQSERSGSPVFSSVSVKSDQSKGEVANFTEETPSSTKSVRSGSLVSSSVSVKSDGLKGEVENICSETPSATKSVRSDSSVLSSVSVKSHQSKGEVANFSSETPSATKSVRSDSSVLSSVSVKSHQSKGEVANFSSETPSATKSVRSDSSVLSAVSVKSHQSKGEVANFREKKSSITRSGSHVSSSVSVRSDHSKGEVANIRVKTPSVSKSVRSGSHVSRFVSVKSDCSKGETWSETTSERSDSDVFSSVSVTSDQSKGEVANFSEKTSPTRSKEQKTTVNIGAEFTRWEALKVQKKMRSDVELATFLLNRVQYEKSYSNSQKFHSRKSFRENLYSIFQELENKITVFMKNELETFKKILKKENTQYFVKDFIEDMYNTKVAALDITLYFLRDMKRDEVADTLKDELVFIHQQQLISRLKKKYQSVSEGIAKHGDSKLLNNIYTDLYITQGGSKQVNTEHEVRQIENVSRCHESQEIQVECTNLFKAHEQDKQIRTVLTKGVAGIGKSVSVQKFIVDWAERLEKEVKEKDKNENQGISFIFPLPFREMNLMEKEKQSLMDIISRFFPEIKGLNLTRRNQFKVLFILDGLDECRLPMNFDGNETWSDVSSPASLDVLLTNLIKGNLLPSSLIWITTRPAAASKIPPDFIDRVTEVRGFNDEQKEEYFKKRFTDENLAKEIIDHVKQSKSLFIMCHIPVFCWISATVLQNILEEKRNDDLKNNQVNDTSKTLQESNAEDTPKTLTQMYTHFLRFQILQSSRKYDGEYTPDVSWDKDAILSLGKLAFHQLERNNLIFCDVDLEACGIDVYKASVYSGMCTQIFKEERGVTVGTMYCFVHLSIQEFIAALYAHLFLNINKKNALVQDSTEQENKNEAMIDMLKTAVDKALESDNGHLDLFLRFLLGLSLQSNRLLLRGLLTQKDSNDQSKKEIVQYIKQKFEANLSPERSINLFYCLNELNDQTLVKEIQNQLNEGSLSSGDLSPAQWSALAFVLLTSDEELEEFELQKFKKSDECFFRLSEVVKNSKRALLNDCNLTDKSCSTLAKALESDNSLIELNMSKNNLQDSGIKKLCTGLRNIKCKLEIIKLSQCMLTEESCSVLASVLSSDSSSLKDLDLSNNNLWDSGVKLLSDGLKGNSKLKKLILANCGITEEGYKALASALRPNPSHLIELDLTGNDPGQSGVKELSDLLQDPICQLKLTFLGAVADEACQYLTQIVGKNPLLLRELDLSECELGDTRVNQIAALLQDKHCKLKTLMLNNNSIREEDYAVLVSAFISNPSNLKGKKLDLSENKLGNSGVITISRLLQNSKCTLQILRLSNCSITEEGYKALASALRSNPSHLTELDLTGNDPGQSGVKELDDLLQDPNCHLKTLRFLGPAADEACQYVTGIVGKNPLLLKKLNLSEHYLGDTQVNQIAALLQDKHCTLNTLMLNKNNITDEGCAALTSAFKLNSSNLIELDLCGNKLGNLGIEKICPLLKNTQCRLKKLKLSNCSITEEGYKALASALRSNPTHLIELDLTGNDPGQSGVKELIDLQQDPNCQLKTIMFLKSPAAQDACDHLTKVLCKSPLLLKELDLSEDKLGDLKWEKLSALLMDSHSKVETMQLNNCELKNCSGLATVLSSKTILKEINLNNSCLLDSGVKKICEGLKNPVCELKILKLSHCNITEEGYKALSSALRSNPSHLIELDLTGNDPGQSGVKELDDLLQDPNCQLKRLRLLQNPDAGEACQYVIKYLGKNPLLLRELNLSGHELGDTQVNQIAALLQDKHCKLNTLLLCDCGLTEQSCSALATVLISNHSLQELDISNNNLQDSGVKKLQKGIENTNCKLEKLRLSNCSINEEGYKALASALRSNPSHLIELDLTGNDPGQSGVKELSDLLQDTNRELKLRFLGPAADEACHFVSETVGDNPLLMRELNLSGQELGDTRVNQIAALLQDKHCQFNKLQLRCCNMTNEGCSALTSALKLNPSQLRELDLSGNELGDKGFKGLGDLLMNLQCKLEKLHLCKCSIKKKQCGVLTSALNSNPSHLRELDLSCNELEQLGVANLCDLLMNPQCKLEKLHLHGCSITEEHGLLTSALKSNPSHLRELYLSRNKLGDSGVKNLSDLLRNPQCKLEKLHLCRCSITEEQCLILTSALKANSLHVKELNLSRNKLRESGVKNLCELLSKPQCKLEKLCLRGCSIREKQCLLLTPMLCLKLSHLRELDLSRNKIKSEGVETLCEILKDSRCKLKRLSLNDCGITDVTALTQSLSDKNTLKFLKELDLRNNMIGNSKQQLSDMLQDSNCKLRIDTEPTQIRSGLIGGWFAPWSPKSATGVQQSSSSDEESSKGSHYGDIEEREWPDEHLN